MSDLSKCVVIGPDGTQYKLSKFEPPSAPERAFVFALNEPIGPQLKEARLRYGNMSQRAFSNFTGVSYVAICRTEKGRTIPRPSTLKSIEAVLSKSAHLLSNANDSE